MNSQSDDPGNRHTPQARAQALRSIDEVNRARVRMGILPLTPDPHLSRIALQHSRDMAVRNFYSHVNPDGAGPADRMVAGGYDAIGSAENIARGYRDGVLVVNGWLDSPGHRDNILNPAFQAIGAGYYVDPALYEGHFWTHLFATPDQSRDRDTATYAEELLALLNQERRAAGYATLIAPPHLQASITRHTALAAAQGPEGFSRDTGGLVRRVAQDAPYAYRRIIAHFVCGRTANTPEDAFDQLLAAGLSRDLLARVYEDAGVGYYYNTDDEHRHYWLVLLSAPA